MVALWAILLASVGSVALIAIGVTGALLLATKAEQRIALPLAIEIVPLAEIRHAPTRDWLHTYTMVLADLGFEPGPILLVPTGLTAGRAALAWFTHPELPTRALLTATARRHAIAFIDGAGATRRETSTGAVPLTLWDREPVARTVRADLTDPARLLAAHAAGVSPEPSAPPPNGPRPDPRDEVAQSYQRVLDDDGGRGWRRVGPRGSYPTLRGRFAAVVRRARGWLHRHAAEAMRM